jgi:hypothetical protein
MAAFEQFLSGSKELLVCRYVTLSFLPEHALMAALGDRSVAWQLHNPDIL